MLSHEAHSTKVQLQAEKDFLVPSTEWDHGHDLPKALEAEEADGEDQETDTWPLPQPGLSPAVLALGLHPVPDTGSEVPWDFPGVRVPSVPSHCGWAPEWGWSPEGQATTEAWNFQPHPFSREERGPENGVNEPLKPL